MSSSSVIESQGAPRPAGAYNQGITAGDFVFTSGQGPFRPGQGTMVGSTVREQTEAALANLEAIVAAAGGSRRDIVKVTAYLNDVGSFAEFDSAYREFFGERLPARTTVGAALNGILIEIDAVAYLPRQEPLGGDNGVGAA